MILRGLRHSRRRRLLTREELGRLVGLRAAAVGALENGERRARASAVARLARALDVPEDDLVRPPPTADPVETDPEAP